MGESPMSSETREPMKAVRPYTKTEQVQTTLTVEQRERLDAYAEKQKVSRADAIRQLVLTGLS